jgi:hypothetical protein
MYAFVRFVAAAALVILPGVVGIGALALLIFPVERPLVATAERSGLPAASCQELFDRDCLSGRELPQDAPPRTANADPAAPVPQADGASVPPATEDVAGLPPAAPSKVPAPVPAAPAERTAAAQPPVAQPESQPPSVAPPPVTPPSEALAPRPAPAPSAAAERQQAKPAILPVSRPAAAKKSARRDRPAKPAANEALTAMRRFGGASSEIPVNAYAPDGTQRTIVIRPTSIQDVYYYSAPR